MRVLLVGASGFIGRHLLEALVAAGHELIATSRQLPQPALPGVHWRALDLERLAVDPAHFQWPEGVELLINASGLLSPDPGALARVQSDGPCALFARAATEGARVLQISALGAGEQPDSPFLASKARADDYLLGLGIPALVLRPSLVLGSGGRSSQWLLRLSPWPLIPLLDRQARLQPLHVQDLVGAVLALLREWPEAAQVLPLVGPQDMTQGQLIDQLRAAQGWPAGTYVGLSAALLGVAAALGDRFGWTALNTALLRLSRRDNLADPLPLQHACGYRAAPLASRLQHWPVPGVSVTAAMRPLLLAALVLVWLWTALVCLGPGYGWGLRIMADAGIGGWPAATAVIGGGLLDGVLGLGLLIAPWRRRVLQVQLGLMLGYSLVISLLLPAYWFDPFAGVAKNAVLLVATLWLLWTEPRLRRSPATARATAE
ncbi:MAG: SDR family oxidoreductase [Pseudomonas sp.]|uniref:SDR family oxidoreductase n=1 Tax=Pseudomonas sp. TaxID=306 RepID=UPI003399A5B8